MERLTTKLTPLDDNKRKSVPRPVDPGWILFIRKSQLNELIEEKHKYNVYSFPVSGFLIECFALQNAKKMVLILYCSQARPI